MIQLWECHAQNNLQVSWLRTYDLSIWKQRKEDKDMGTGVVGAIVVLVVAVIIRSMVKDKKAGKSLQCGMDCKHCGGHCNHH